MDEYGEQKDYDWFVHMIETYKSPSFVHENGQKNKGIQDFDFILYTQQNETNETF